MGRPRMDEVREREIVDAFLRCISEKGLDETTLDDVSRAAGLRRGTVRHFVGNRRDLTHLAAKRLMEIYEEQFEVRTANLPEANPAATLLDYLFLALPKEFADEARAMEVLLGLAAQDAELREELRKMYEMYDQRVAAVLTGAFPKAPHERCLEVAYGLVCLAEQNERFQIMGFPGDRSGRARAAAEVLVSSLAGERR